MRRTILGFCAATLVLLGVRFGRADNLINHLEHMASHNRGVRGEYCLVTISNVKNEKNRRRSAKLTVLKHLGAETALAKPEVETLTYVPAGNFPTDKPIIALVWHWKNTVRLQSMYRAGGKGNVFFLERGGLDDRYFQLTDEILFKRRKAGELAAFFDKLLALSADDDIRIADMASHYLGSKLSPYNKTNVSEKMVEAITDRVLACKNAQVLAHLVAFYRNVKLPADPDRLMTLLRTDNPVILGPVTYQVKRSTENVKNWQAVFHRALVDPSSEKLRTTILDCLLSWGPSASAHWDTLEKLALGAQRLKPDETEQALAAQVLVRIDPQRAADTVRKALPELDSPAIYRFVYEQKMYDTVGVLIDKLRENRTQQDKIVKALLAALTRNIAFDSEQQWVAWWDGLAAEGDRRQLVSNNFVPVGKPSAKIDRLIAQLGSADFTKRQTAVAQLSEIGPVANPKLEGAQAHKDFEVAESARQLLAENQRRLQPVVDTLYGRSTKQNTPRNSSTIQREMLLKKKLGGF